ncbi:helix-turn-helix domain-containing protein [Mesorhizobium sp. P5_C1]
MIKMKGNATSSKPKAKAQAKAKPEPVAAAPAAPQGKAKKKPAPKRKAPKVKAKAAPQQAAPQPKVDPTPKAERPQGGGTQPKLTEKDVQRVIAILQMCGGIKSAAAEKLNVSRQTLYTYLNEHPEVAEASAEIDEDIKDLTELKIIQAIRAGEMNTVRWFAEMKMKDRGYVRRVETTGKDGGPVEHSQKLDLSKLSDEELEIMYRAAERRESTSGGK